MNNERLCDHTLFMRSILVKCLFCAHIAGTVLSPWMAAPFISHETPTQLDTQAGNNSVSVGQNLTTNNSTQERNFSDVLPSHTTTSTETKFFYAFGLLSVWYVIVAVIFAKAYFAFKKENATRTAHEHTAHRTRTRSSGQTYEPTWYRLTMLLLTALRFGSVVGLESQFTAYLVVFGVKGLGMSKTDGLALTSAFRTAFTASRVLNIGAALCLRPYAMIAMDAVIFLVAYGAMLPTVQHFTWAIWTGCVVAGFGMGSFYGASISWTEKNLKVTGKAASVIVVGDSLGVMVMTFVIGHLFDSVGPMSFLYTCFADTFVIALACCLCSILACFYRKTLVLDADNRKLIPLE